MECSISTSKDRFDRRCHDRRFRAQKITDATFEVNRLATDERVAHTDHGQNQFGAVSNTACRASSDSCKYTEGNFQFLVCPFPILCR